MAPTQGDTRFIVFEDAGWRSNKSKSGRHDGCIEQVGMQEVIDDDYFITNKQQAKKSREMEERIIFVEDQ